MSETPGIPARNPRARGRGVVVEIEPDDVLTDALNALGLRSRVFCRSELITPWALDVPAGDYAHFHIIDRGGGSLFVHEGREPIRLRAGDVVVLPRGRGHVLSDGPAVTPVRLGSVATTSRPGRVSVIRNSTRGPATRMICGSFELRHREGASVLLQLPEVLHVRGHDGRPPAWLAATVELLVFEAHHLRPGRSAVMTRLTDILLIQVLRHWLERSSGARRWLIAVRDKQIGAALSLIHRHLEREWTVHELARQIGMSRSAFADRFKALLGEPPLSYIARWRMLRAAQWLRETETPVVEIASRIGYADAGAFSKTFKRHIGTTPAAYRRAR